MDHPAACERLGQGSVSLVREHGAREAVRDDVRESLGGMTRIERHIGAARLQHAEDAGDHHGVMVEQQGDPRPLFTYGRRHRRGDSIGRFVERRVRPLPSRLPDGDTTRVLFDLPGEALHDGLLDRFPGERDDRAVRLRRVARAERSAALERRENRQGGDPLPRIGDDALEQDLESLQQAIDRRAFEEIGAVADAADDPLRTIVGLQVQVEPGYPRVHVHLGQVPARTRGGQGRLEDEHDLEQRVAAGISIGLQALHHLLDRDIAAGERLERRLAHVPQKLPEAEILRQTRPEHQRVEEEAQEALELGPAAARGHRPDEDVLLACVAVEQDVERGQERHEERRLLPPRERLELFAQSLR